MLNRKATSWIRTFLLVLSCCVIAGRSQGGGFCVDPFGHEASESTHHGHDHSQDHEDEHDLQLDSQCCCDQAPVSQTSCVRVTVLPSRTENKHIIAALPQMMHDATVNCDTKILSDLYGFGIDTNPTLPLIRSIILIA